MNSPVLSICIPTYNRAYILDKSLQTLVCQDIFQKTNEVEIVISDNCSSDNTRSIVYKYINKYGDKIKYSVNQKNVQDMNFPLALKLGKGKFLKLCNDTILYSKTSLEDMIYIIKNNLDDMPILFFLNEKEKNTYSYNSLNEFIAKVSFMITWSGSFGIWKDDVKYLKYMEKFTNTRLCQSAVLLKMIDDKKNVKVITNHLFDLYKPSLSGNYNLAEVFIQNYLQILKPFVSPDIYNSEKYRILAEHVLPRQFNLGVKYYYKKENFWNYTRDFHSDLKFYILILSAFLSKYAIGFRNNSKNIRLYLFGHKILSFKRRNKIG